MSKLANTEQVMAALEAKLSAADAAVKKREMDSDFRERSLQPDLTSISQYLRYASNFNFKYFSELLSKRKEMESWDVLLRCGDLTCIIAFRSIIVHFSTAWF